MTRRLVVEGGSSLRGVPRIPGDKSISHRALLLAARAGEASRLRNLSGGADVSASRRLIERLGSQVEPDGTAVIIRPGRPASQRIEVDCGNSGTTMRLGAGLLAGAAVGATLRGDASLSRRPMERVVDPLRRMGADITSESACAPLRLEPAPLQGIVYRPAVASAQLKGAVLLAGLGAEGETVVQETVSTRAHTEELLAQAGADLDVSNGEVRLRPSALTALDLEVPGDPSAAAFWAVAALLCPGSRLTIERVYRGQARDGFITVLNRMGAGLRITEREGGSVDIEAGSAPLEATTISDPLEVAACIDELPVLMVAAAFASGTTVIRGAGELRVKESDRIDLMATNLRALGARVETASDGISVEGRGLRGADVDAEGDHRVAMAMAVAGLAASGRTTISGWESVAISDPGFEQALADVRIT